MFTASYLTLETKRTVYRSVALHGSVALWYGPPTQELLLDRFHWRCIRCILGISITVQWKNHLITAELAGRFGMIESIGGSEGRQGVLYLLLPPLYSQYYVDTRNWNHAFTLYSEV